jgi:hypothetical protein
MNSSTKRACILAILLSLGTALWAAHPALAQQSAGNNGLNSGFDNLYGWYGLLVSGPSATPGAGGEYLSGALFFDGHGGISGKNVNGGINGQSGNTSVTGSYAASTQGASPEEMIDITLQLLNQLAPQTYVVSVRRSNGEAVGIETDGSAIATIDLRPQFDFPNPSSFNNAALSGSFAAICTGNPGNFAQLNSVTFDGKGNLAGVDAYDDNNVEGVDTFSGTYTVNSDGTFSAVTAPTVSITGVIDNFYTEIAYTYNVAGLGEIMACVGKK